MRNYIGFDKIKIRCGRSEYKDERTCADKTEPKNSKWSDFKTKAKNVFGKVKKIVCVVTDCLIMARTFFKSVTEVRKEYKKLRKAFA